MGILATLTGLRLLRFILRVVALVVLLILVYLVVTAVQVWLTGRRYEPRAAGAIVVMGAAQYNGVPSPDLASRLDEAETLWRQRFASTIMVTGSKERGDVYTEAQASERYLVAAGDPRPGHPRGRRERHMGEPLRCRAGPPPTGRSHRAHRHRPLPRGPSLAIASSLGLDPVSDTHQDLAHQRVLHHPVLCQGDGRHGAGPDHRVRPPECPALIAGMIPAEDLRRTGTGPMNRNVLFITVDQWRGDSLSALGHPVLTTPTLDRLAARGTLFANHWANAAPCGPSRACLYTGTYLHRNRSVSNGTPLDSRFTNVALLARQAGYDPVLFGYTDTSLDPRDLPADDPRLRSYEEVLPGFRAVLYEPWEAGSRQWGRWLAAQGVDVPANPHDLYLPIPDFPGADAPRVDLGAGPVHAPISRRRRSWSRPSPPGWTSTATSRSSSMPRSSGPIRRVATRSATTISTTPMTCRRSRRRRPRRMRRPPTRSTRCSCTSPWPAPRKTRPNAARCGPPTTGPRRRSTTSWAGCSTTSTHWA